MSGPQETSFSLASYQVGNEAQIISLFTTVFSGSKSLEHWRWQFEANPYGRVFSGLAWSDKGRLVGQCAVMPVDLNLMGRRIKAGQALDTMVHPDFRNRGIFERTAQYCIEQLQEAGHVLVYGFPNRQAYPGWMRKLGWQRVAYSTHYQMRLSIYSAVRRTPWLSWLAKLTDVFYRGLVAAETAWRRYLLRRNLGVLTCIVTGRVPAAYEELWQSLRAYEVLSIWKDVEYFRWRYDQKPKGDYRYYFLEREGRIEALCVATLTDGMFRIAELIARDQSVQFARYLITELALRGLRHHAHVMEFFGISSGFFDEVFAGFKRTTDTNNVFCLGVLEGQKLAELAPLPFNWTITAGDSDAI
jgi:GNAT superfamily N-acetyltransferase